MSSHYIIRENQEPGLLILKAEAVEFHVIESLLEWSPHLIVNEISIPILLKNNIKPDAIMVDDPDLNWKSLFEFQWPVTILNTTKYPDCIYEHLHSRKISALNIVDDFQTISLRDITLLHEHFESLVVYSRHLKYQYSKNGKFEKWISPGRGLVIPQFCRKQFWISENIKRVKGDRFEVVKEGNVWVRSKFDFWTGENVI